MPREAAKPILDLSGNEPPAGLSVYQKALWYDAKGMWDEAHDGVATASGPMAAWMHAYLHRKEGDFGNARYWYARAGRSAATGSLEAEWRDLAAAAAAQKDVDSSR